VTGLVCRDQMVGPWQVPVADAAVTTTSYNGSPAKPMAMGERTPLALLNAAASARMAVGEALTNIASAPIAQIGDIKTVGQLDGRGRVSRRGCAASTRPVRAVGSELAPALGIAIPSARTRCR